MRDRELYGKILGVKPPWEVEDVDLDRENEEVRVHLRNSRSELPCPVCGQTCGRYDARSRRWRHLDTCQYRTILVAEVPRVRCPEHGVVQVTVPWAEAGSGFTALYEALIIDWLQESCISAVARRMRLSWRQVDTVMKRAVRRGLARRQAELPAHIGVDEKSFQKRHEYVTIVLDQARKAVVWVADGRGRDTLDTFFRSFSWEQREQVKTVAMDMWGPYITSTMEAIPGAQEKISFDKFHVAQHLGDAVDKVRRQEHKALQERGDERLKGSKYLWLQNPDAMSPQGEVRFEALRDSSLKTSRAWSIKELAMLLWEQISERDDAEEAWRRWYGWAIRSKLEPIKKVARLIRRHLYGILNAMVHRVTNARAEGLNSLIQWLKYSARGFRNRDRFRNAIYFHLGGLDLYPEGVR